MPNTYTHVGYLKYTNSDEIRGFSISFWITTPIYHDLKKISAETGYSMSEIVRKAIQKWLEVDSVE